MTKREAIKLFREHWRFLAASGTKKKIAFKKSEEWVNNCALCEYVWGLDNRYSICSTVCPVVWPGGSCSSWNSPYIQWTMGCNILFRKVLALEISELPERKKLSGDPNNNIKMEKNNGNPIRRGRQGGVRNS